MPWYIASSIQHRPQERGALTQATESWRLLQAATSDAAYQRAHVLASEVATPASVLDGISELLAFDGPPADEIELTWTQQEMPPESISALLREKRELSVFAEDQAPSVPPAWYIAKIVLVEIHDTGSHGHRLLVWTNTHLIAAGDPESAYSRCLDLGRRQEQDSGAHRCNGDLAHWKFEGLRDLIRAIAPPQDGSILWVQEFDAFPEDLLRSIPPRSELGVFEWEARSGAPPS